jgi:predicted deacylase
MNPADGRLPVHEIYSACDQLTREGFTREVVAVSRRGGISLPIVSWRSAQKGPALWILSGIHGEEPAGPNAIARAIPLIAELNRPVVLLPLCNPTGYARSWRYLNRQKWSAVDTGASVGDAEHLLLAFNRPARTRAGEASSPEARMLTRHVLELARDYPPRLALDLHDDDMLAQGYV